MPPTAKNGFQVNITASGRWEPRLRSHTSGAPALFRCYNLSGPSDNAPCSVRDMNDKMILCPVGDQMRLVDHDLFIEIHEQLAAHYRQLGLTGHRLDLAIETHLPCRLEQILDGSTVH